VTEQADFGRAELSDEEQKIATSVPKEDEQNPLQRTNTSSYYRNQERSSRYGEEFVDKKDVPVENQPLMTLSTNENKENSSQNMNHLLD
jgi:hypothetical protein